jgi:hypothetical protein
MTSQGVVEKAEKFPGDECPTSRRAKLLCSRSPTGTSPAGSEPVLSSGTYNTWQQKRLPGSGECVMCRVLGSKYEMYWTEIL